MKGLRLLQIVITVVIISTCSCSPKHREEKVVKASIPTVKVLIPVFKDVDPEVKHQLSSFLDGYFKLNQALIEDSHSAAKTAAAALSETSKSLLLSNLTGEQMDFYLVESSKLKAGLQAVRDSGNIESAREGLAQVSEAMYALVKAFHPNEVTLYYQYCPMARKNHGANWISATQELVNPYMGQMMLRCGRTQEKLD